MAKTFNLTAELNLRGPSNIGSIVGNIKKQLGSINADVNLKINPTSARNVAQLTANLNKLTTAFNASAKSATAAASAINAFGTSLNSSSLRSSAQQISSIGSSLSKLNNSSSKVKSSLAQATGEMQEFGKQSALAVRRFAAFSVATTAIFGLTNAITQGIKAFIDYDKEFIKLRQVTGQSAQGLKSLSDEITSLSTSLGVSSSELVDVSSTLAQAGLSAKDTEKALKALALSSLAPSFDSMNETVEGSIALMRQFGISAGDLDKALSSINTVAAKFAVEASDIITAIQRTGGVFATASKGVSEGTDALNEFIAVFTSVRATTRESAETIATGLRTIFTRVQRGSTIDALKEYGVNLQDAEGKFVGAYKAVELLSKGLNSIDPRDLKFSKIVEELGGFRQIGKVIPLIQQFATAQDALRTAQQGQGSLTKDSITAQQSLANQISKVREEFLALFREIGNSKTFQVLASGALSVASAIIKVADSLKGILPALAIIGAFKGFSALTQYATGFASNIGSQKKNGGGKIMQFARGGVVPGQGNSDTVPAMLMPGEFVIRKKAVETIGTDNLHKMNKYADGGPVKASESPSSRVLNKYSIGGYVQKNKLSELKSLERLYKSNPNIQGFDEVQSTIIPTYLTPTQEDFKRYWWDGIKEQKSMTRTLEKKYGNSKPRYINFRGPSSFSSSLDPKADQWYKGNAFQEFIEDQLSRYGVKSTSYDDPSLDFFADLDFNIGDAKFVKDVSSYSTPNTDQAKEILSKRLRQTVKDKQLLWNPLKDSKKLENTAVFLPAPGIKEQLDAWYVEQVKQLIGNGSGEEVVADQSIKRLMSGGYVQKFMAGGKAESTPFGTGVTRFPKRISNLYEREMRDKVLKAKSDELFADGMFDIPKDERINIDESKASEEFSKPFDRQKFMDSFKSKITRNSLYKNLSDFAKFIGLPSEDLSKILPQSIDFGGEGMRIGMLGAFFNDPFGARGYDNLDLSSYGFSTADEQDLYGYQKLLQEKKKEVNKIIKTPIETFDDGSFRYDEAAFIKAFDEQSAIKLQISKVMDKQVNARKAAMEARKQIAESTARGVVGIGGSLGSSIPGKNDTLYHELTHQLFKSLKLKQADSFTKYKDRVEQLFNSDNDALSDAFDALPGSSYSSADVVYGRYYKNAYLSQALNNNRSESIKAGGRDINPELSKDGYLALNKSQATKKAREYKPINPQINKLLLAGGIKEESINKAEDIGKEEFLTTLIQKAPELDTNMQKILDSTLNELMSNAGIVRQTYRDGGRVKRSVGYIDSDVLSDPKNLAIIQPIMEKLGISDISDYKQYLSELSASARKSKSISRLRAIVGLPGAGKSSLMLGNAKSDNATLRETKRFPILTPDDIKQATEIIDTSATVTPEKLEGYLKAADRIAMLSTSTKEERKELRRRRQYRADTGVNLFGRSASQGLTAGAPTDSGPMEAELASEIDPSKILTLGLRPDFKLSRKTGNDLPLVETRKIALANGAFSPATRGHKELQDAATSLGFTGEDFLALIGSDEALKSTDPHSFRTAVFDQDFRALLAKAAFSGASVSKKPRGFGIPSVFEVDPTNTGQRRFIKPDKGSIALVGDDKDDKDLEKYIRAGLTPVTTPRTEGVSGTEARAAILAQDTAKMQSLLSPEVFDLVQKNASRLQNRANIIPRLIENAQQRSAFNLQGIESQLAKLPTRIDKKRVETDPEYAAIADQVYALRAQRDKLKNSANLEPFTILRKLANRYPDRYGLDMSGSLLSTEELSPILQSVYGQAQASGKSKDPDWLKYFTPPNQTSLDVPASKLSAFFNGRRFPSDPALGAFSGLTIGPKEINKVWRDKYSDMMSPEKVATYEAAKAYLAQNFSEAKNEQKALAIQNIEKSTKVGIVGLQPLDKSEIQGPMMLGGENVSLFIAGLSSRYSEAITNMRANLDKGVTQFAQDIQNTKIFGGSDKLVFDFDETLVKGADIFGPDGKPDIPAYSDLNKVQAALANGELTSLGNKLQDMIALDPSFAQKIRVLTARPQNNAGLLSARLNELNLPIAVGQITGVSGANKGLSMVDGEKLIDDNIKNILDAQKAGKNAVQYGELRDLSDAEKGATGFANAEGAILEAMLSKLGAKGGTIQNRAIDYADGLGIAAQYFPGIGSDWPTEVKRTVDATSIAKAKEEFIRYYSEKNGLQIPAKDKAVQLLASGGKVKLYHGSNTGVDDATLKSFKEKGALSDIATGYGQGAGFYVWSDKESAKEQANMRVKGGLGSFTTVSGDTSGRPMVVTFEETPEPATWDLDYETNKGPVVNWLVKNFDQLKDKLVPTDRLTGIKNIIQENKDQGIMSAGIRVEEADQRMMSDTGEEMIVTGRARKSIYAGTASDIREAELIGQIMNRLQSQDPKLVEDFENEFFNSPTLSSGDWTNLALKYVGSSPLIPTNIETFATGGSVEDTVPALLTPGEFVINKKAAQNIGYAKLAKLNKADKIQGFNKGGAVGIQRFAAGGSPLPLRPDIISRGTIDISDLVPDIIKLSEALGVLGDKSSAVASLLEKNKDNSSLKDLERAAVKDIAMLKLVGASISEVASAEKALADIRKKGRESIALRTSLEDTFSKRGAAGKPLIGGATTTDKLGLSSASAQQAIALQAEKIMESRISDLKSRGVTVSEEKLARIRETSYTKATTAVTGISRTSLNAQGITGEAIQQYIAESMRDRKTLAQMDKEYIAIRQAELRAAGKTASEAKKIAEEEIATRRDLVNELAKSKGETGPGSAGIGLLDIGKSPVLEYLKTNQGQLAAGIATALASGYTEKFLGQQTDVESVRRNAAAKSALSITGNSLVLASQMDKSGIVALLDSVKPGLGQLAKMAVILGGALAGAADAAFDFTGTQAAAIEAFQKSERDKKLEASSAKTAKAFDVLNKVTNEKTVKDAKDALMVSSADTTDSVIKDTRAKAKEAVANRPVMGVFGQQTTAGYLNYLPRKFGFAKEMKTEALAREETYTEAAQDPRVLANLENSKFLLSKYIEIGIPLEKIKDVDPAVWEDAVRNMQLSDKEFLKLSDNAEKLSEAELAAAKAKNRLAAETKLANDTTTNAASSAAKLKKAMDDLNKSGKQLAQSIASIADTINQSINRVNFEADQSESFMSSRSEALEGNAKVSKFVSTNSNILNNPKTYDEKSYRTALAQSFNILGDKNKTDAQNLANIAVLDKDLSKAVMASIGKAVSAVDAGGKGQNVEIATLANDAKKSGTDIIQKLGLPSDIEKLFLTQFGSAVDAAKTSSDEKVKENSGNLEAAQQEFKSQLESNLTKIPESARKLAIQLDEFRAGAFNRYTNAVNAAAAKQLEANKYAKARITISQQADAELKKAITGVEPSFIQKQSQQNQITSAMTGGLTNPDDIKNKIIKDTEEKLALEKKRSEVGTDTVAFKQLTDQISALSIGIDNAKSALDDMASSGDLASIALQRIQKANEDAKNRQQFLEQILTQTPEEANKFNKTLIKLQGYINGQTNNMSSAAKKAGFNAYQQTGSVRKAAIASRGVMAQERGDSIQLLNQYIPLEEGRLRAQQAKVISDSRQNKVPEGQIENILKQRGLTDDDIIANSNRLRASAYSTMARESGISANDPRMPLIMQSLSEIVNPTANPGVALGSQDYKKAESIQLEANKALETLATNQANLAEASDILSKSFENLSSVVNNARKIDKDIVAGSASITITGKVDMTVGAVAGGAPAAVGGGAIPAVAPPVGPLPRAKGGIIYAQAGQLINFQPKGTDTVPAMLTPGEFVVNAKSTAQHLPLLKAINSGTNIVGNTAMMSDGGVVYLAYGSDKALAAFKSGKKIIDSANSASESYSAIASEGLDYNNARSLASSSLDTIDYGLNTFGKSIPGWSPISYAMDATEKLSTSLTDPNLSVSERAIGIGGAIKSGVLAAKDLVQMREAKDLAANVAGPASKASSVLSTANKFLGPLGTALTVGSDINKALTENSEDTQNLSTVEKVLYATTTGSAGTANEDGWSKYLAEKAYDNTQTNSGPLVSAAGFNTLGALGYGKGSREELQEQIEQGMAAARGAALLSWTGMPLASAAGAGVGAAGYTLKVAGDTAKLFGSEMSRGADLDAKMARLRNKQQNNSVAVGSWSKGGVVYLDIGGKVRKDIETKLETEATEAANINANIKARTATYNAPDSKERADDEARGRELVDATINTGTRDFVATTAHAIDNEGYVANYAASRARRRFEDNTDMTTGRVGDAWDKLDDKQKQELIDKEMVGVQSVVDEYKAKPWQSTVISDKWKENLDAQIEHSSMMRKKREEYRTPDERQRLGQIRMNSEQGYAVQANMGDASATTDRSLLNDLDLVENKPNSTNMGRMANDAVNDAYRAAGIPEKAIGYGPGGVFSYTDKNGVNWTERMAAEQAKPDFEARAQAEMVRIKERERKLAEERLRAANVTWNTTPSDQALPPATAMPAAQPTSATTLPSSIQRDQILGGLQPQVSHGGQPDPIDPETVAKMNAAFASATTMPAAQSTSATATAMPTNVPPTQTMNDLAALKNPTQQAFAELQYRKQQAYLARFNPSTRKMMERKFGSKLLKPDGTPIGPGPKQINKSPGLVVEDELLASSLNAEEQARYKALEERRIKFMNKPPGTAGVLTKEERAEWGKLHRGRALGAMPTRYDYAALVSLEAIPEAKRRPEQQQEYLRLRYQIDKSKGKTNTESLGAYVTEKETRDKARHDKRYKALMDRKNKGGEGYEFSPRDQEFIDKYNKTGGSSQPLSGAGLAQQAVEQAKQRSAEEAVLRDNKKEKSSDEQIAESIAKTKERDKKATADRQERAANEAAKKESLRQKAIAAGWSDSTFEYEYKEAEKYGVDLSRKIPLDPKTIAANEEKLRAEIDAIPKTTELPKEEVKATKPPKAASAPSSVASSNYTYNNPVDITIRAYNQKQRIKRILVTENPEMTQAERDRLEASLNETFATATLSKEFKSDEDVTYDVRTEIMKRAGEQAKNIRYKNQRMRETNPSPALGALTAGVQGALESPTAKGIASVGKATLGALTAGVQRVLESPIVKGIGSVGQATVGAVRTGTGLVATGALGLAGEGYELIRDDSADVTIKGVGDNGYSGLRNNPFKAARDIAADEALRGMVNMSEAGATIGQGLSYAASSVNVPGAKLLSDSYTTARSGAEKTADAITQKRAGLAEQVVKGGSYIQTGSDTVVELTSDAILGGVPEGSMLRKVLPKDVSPVLNADLSLFTPKGLYQAGSEISSDIGQLVKDFSSIDLIEAAKTGRVKSTARTAFPTTDAVIRKTIEKIRPGFEVAKDVVGKGMEKAGQLGKKITGGIGDALTKDIITGKKVPGYPIPFKNVPGQIKDTVGAGLGRIKKTVGSGLESIKETLFGKGIKGTTKKIISSVPDPFAVTGVTSTAVAEKITKNVTTAQDKAADLFVRYASSPENATRAALDKSKLVTIPQVAVDASLSGQTNTLTKKVGGIGGQYTPKVLDPLNQGKVSFPNVKLAQNPDVALHEVLHGVQDNLGFFADGNIAKNHLDSLKPQMEEFLKPGGAYDKLVAESPGIAFYTGQQIKDAPFELLTSIGQVEGTKAFKKNKEAQQMLREVVKAMGYNNGGIVYAANGALIPAMSRGTDTVPAMLTPGEFVVNRQATMKHMPLLNAINSGQYTRDGITNYLASGGMVAPRYYAAGNVVSNSGGVSNNGAMNLGGMSDLMGQITAIKETVNSLQNFVPSLGEVANTLSEGLRSGGEMLNNASNNIRSSTSDLATMPTDINITQTSQVNVAGIPQGLNDFGNSVLNSVPSIAANEAKNFGRQVDKTQFEGGQNTMNMNTPMGGGGQIA